MPATTIASSGVPARSDVRIDAFGPRVMLAAIAQRRAGVAHEPEGLRVVRPDLPGVHVDLDHLLLGPRGGEGQAAADDEDHVGRLEVAPEGALSPERRAEREVARVADRALALGRLDDARLEVLGHGGEHVVAAGEVDA